MVRSSFGLHDLAQEYERGGLARLEDVDGQQEGESDAEARVESVRVDEECAPAQRDQHELHQDVIHLRC